MAPMVPILRPCQSVPSEWAASSMTGMPRASHRRHDRVHVGGVAAHVADDDGGDVVVEFGGEIGDVDAVVLGDFHENRLAIAVHHGRRHGGEGEGRDQHPRAGLQVERAERQEDRGRAGGDGERVFRAHVVGELPLKKGHGGILGRGIPEQVAGTQEAVDFRSGGLGDGFGVIDVGCNAVIGRHGFTFLKCPISRILTCVAD
jgi:hypothetical protein